MIALIGLGTALELVVCLLILFSIVEAMAWFEKRRPQTPSERHEEEREEELAEIAAEERTKPLTWAEVEDFDWSGFSEARTRWERESEFSDRISNPKASVHIFPTERRSEWKFSPEDEAA